MKRKGQIFVLVILGLSTLLGFSNGVLAQLESDEPIVIESYIPNLDKVDNGTVAYVKFQNSTGIYKTTDGETTELESFVEPEWMQEYRDYLKQKERHEKAERKLKAFHNGIERILTIAYTPFALLLAPFLSISESITSTMVNTAQTSTAMIQDEVQPSVQDFVDLTQETFDNTIEGEISPIGVEFKPPMFTYDYDTAEEDTLDSSVYDATDEFSGGPNVVFVNNTHGYAFFQKLYSSVRQVAYYKSTDGGSSWSGPSYVTKPAAISSGSFAMQFSVWYDRWTPDNTSTKIHIAVPSHENTGYARIWYNYLDITDDSTGTWVDVSGDLVDYSGTYCGGFVTVSTAGELYVGAGYNNAPLFIYIYKYNGSWNLISDSTSWPENAIDDVQLLPLSDGDILAIYDETDAEINSRVWNNTADSWSSETDIAYHYSENNADYMQNWGAVTNPNTNDVYLTHNDLAQASTGDLECWLFNDSTRAWTQKTDVATDAGLSSDEVKPIYDTNSGNLIAVYIIDDDIYVKNSTDGGSTWSSAVEITSATQEWIVIRTNFHATSVAYVIYFDNTNEDMYGNRIDFLFPNDPTLNTDSGNTYAGKTHTIITDHTHDNGDTDIDLMYLQYNWEGQNITMSCPQATSSGSVTIVVGSGYLIGTPTYSHTTAPTNGYRVTWTIVLDWDFPSDDDSYGVWGRTKDDHGHYSNWKSLDTNNVFENDLLVNSATFTGEAFPDGIEDGGGATLDDSEWFRGGMDLTVTGYIRYQGATSVSPNTDAVDVELYEDGGALGESYDDDTLGSDGAFSIATYVTTSTAGIDANYDYDVILADFLGSGSDASNHDKSSGNYKIDASRDNENPTVTDPMSAYGESGNTAEANGEIDTNTFYFSDSIPTLVSVTATATMDDGSGSGSYGVDYGLFGDNDPALDTSAPYTGMWTLTNTDTSGSITVTVFDNVNNSASSSITGTEDGTNPALSVTWNFNINDWAIKSGTDFGFTDIDVISAQDTGSGLDYCFYRTVNSTFTGSPNYLEVGMNGDKSDNSYLDNPCYITDDTLTTGTYYDDEYSNNELYIQVGIRDMVANYGIATRYVRLDRTAPTFSSADHTTDPDSGGDGYTPTLYYEDDQWGTVVFSGCSDGGSGLDYYGVKSNEHGTYGYSATTTVQCQLVVETSNNMYYIINDTVGNEVTGDIGINLFYGIINPSGFDLDIIESLTPVWISDITDITSGTLYYDSSQSGTWYIVSDADGSADWGSGGSKYVHFPAGFGVSDKSDSSAPYESFSYEISGATDTSLTINIVNECSWVQTIVLTMEDDTTDPLMFLTPVNTSESSNYLFYDNTESLVCYSNFDEGSGTATYDLVGGDANSWIGTPTWLGTSYNTQADYCLDFTGGTGNDRIGIDWDGTVIKDKLTFMQWIDTDDHTDTWVWTMSGGDIRTGIYSVAGKMAVIMYDSASKHWAVGTSNEVIGTDEWIHFAFTYDSDPTGGWAENTKIYINGEEVVTNLASSDSGYDPQDFDGFTAFTLGIYVAGQEWDGSMDDVALYSSVLTAGEIKTIYQQSPYYMYGYYSDNMGSSYSDGLGYVPSSENQILYMDFNEATGSYVFDSDNDHYGTLTNGPTWTASSYDTLANGSIDFEKDDSEYIEITDHNDFSFTNGENDLPFSISVWVNFESITPDNNTIIAKYRGDISAREWKLGLDSNGIIRFWLAHYDSYSDRIGREYNTPLATDIFYNIIITYDGSETEEGIKIWLDGVRVDDDTFSSGTYTGMTNTDSNLTFGYNYYGSEYFDGLMDDMVIYDKELDPHEVQQLYSMYHFRVGGFIVESGSGIRSIESFGGSITDYAMVNGTFGSDGWSWEEGDLDDWTYNGGGSYSISDGQVNATMPSDYDGLRIHLSENISTSTWTRFVLRIKASSGISVLYFSLYEGTTYRRTVTINPTTAYSAYSLDSGAGANFDMFYLWNMNSGETGWFMVDYVFLLTGTPTNAVFGNGAENSGTGLDWWFDYEIDGLDSGTAIFTFTVSDYVGHSDTQTFIFYEDNTNPTTEQIDIQTNENTSTMYYPLPSGVVDYAIDNGTFGTDGWSFVEEDWTDLSGWAWWNGASTSGGQFSGVTDGARSYAYIDMWHNGAIDSSTYTHLILYARTNASDLTGISWDINDGNNDAIGNSGQITSNDWTVYVIDLSIDGDWSGTETGVRILITNSTGNFGTDTGVWIEYVRLINPPSGYTPSADDFRNYTYFSDNMATNQELWLKFDGIYNDSSSNYLEISTRGNPQFNSSSYSSAASYAMEFDGVNDEVRVTDDDAIDLVSDWSIVLWVYIDSSAGAYDRIISKGQTTDPHEDYVISTGNVNTTIRFQKKNGGSYEYQDLTGLTIEAWYFIVWTFDSGRNAKFYSNGIHQSGLDTTFATVCETGTENLFIGIRQGFANDFSGMIDDVMIYTRVLTESQIQAMYDSMFYQYVGGASYDSSSGVGEVTIAPPQDNDTILILDFEEGIGDNAFDSSGYYNNASIENGTAWKQVIINGVSTWVLEFDGTDDYVRIDNPLGYNFTVEIYAWISSDNDLTGLNAYQGNGLIWADVGGTNNDTIPMAILNGSLAFGTGMVGGTPVYSTALSATQINTGEWWHIIVTREIIGSVETKKIYLNGVLDNTTTSGIIEAVDVISYMDIGANTLDAQYFKGEIAFVKMLGKPISAEEASSRYAYTMYFGDNPSNIGSSPSFNYTIWNFAHNIDYNDSNAIGTVNITYTTVDNVGNTVYDTFTFYMDNTAPVLDWIDIYTNESSNHLYYPIPSGNTDFAMENGTWGTDGWSFVENTSDDWVGSSGGSVANYTGYIRTSRPLTDGYGVEIDVNSTTLMSYDYVVIMTRGENISSPYFTWWDEDYNYYQEAMLFEWKSYWAVYILELDSVDWTSQSKINRIRVYGSGTDTSYFDLAYVRILETGGVTLNADDFNLASGNYIRLIDTYLELYVDFNEGTGTQLDDESSNDRDITEINFVGTEWESTYNNKTGYAFHLDGSLDYFIAPLDGQDMDANGWTLGGWYKLDVTGSAQGWWNFYDSVSTEIAFKMYCGAANTPTIIIDTSGTAGQWTSTYTVDTDWHFYVVTWSGNIVDDPVLYIDGDLIALTEAATPTGSIDDDVDQVSFGKHNGYYWDGLIDDCFVLNSSITATQVWNLYTSMRGGMAFYGSNMGSAQTFTIGGAVYDNYMSNVEISASTAFGDSPTDSTPSSFSFAYTIEASDNGNVTVYITVSDNVGHTVMYNYYFYEDNTNPTCTILDLTETSDFLHTSGTTIFWYGDDMPTGQTLEVDVSSFGGTSGVYAVQFNGFWGTANWNDTSLTYSRTYTIDNLDTDVGTLTVTAYDNVGNTLSDSFTIYRDTQSSTSYIIDITESSEYIYTEYILSTGVLTIYTSDAMGDTAQSLLLEVGAVDSNLVSDGGFESGEDYAWSTNNTFIGTTSGSYVYSGSWGHQLSRYDTGWYYPAWIEQNVSVSVDDIISFTYWIRTINVDQFVKLTVTYTDLTTTEYYSSSTTWGQVDATSQLTSGKTIQTIRFTAVNGSASLTAIDEIVIQTQASASNSGVRLVQFLESAWGDNSPANDSTSTYTYDFQISSNEDSTTWVIRFLDNVGNWENTLEIIIIDEGSGPNVALGIGVDNIVESSLYLYAPDNTTLYYGSPSINLSDDKLAYWTFNDGSTATDDSGNGYDGIINGASFVSGRYGYALDFERSSSQYVDIGHHEVFSFWGIGIIDKPFSIGGWVKLESYNNWMAIISKWESFGNRQEWQLFTNGADTYFRIYNEAGIAWIGRKISTALTLGNWHHIVGTYSASETSAGISIYINGTEVTGVVDETGLYWGKTTTISEVYIGGTVSGNYFDGLIDEAMISNKELSPSEVSDLYTTGSWPNATFNTIYTYNGSAGISHVNTTVSWFETDQSPSDSSDPYSLLFAISNADTQTGTMYIAIWTNTGQTTNDTVTIYRDTSVNGWVDSVSHSITYIYDVLGSQELYYSSAMPAAPPRACQFNLDSDEDVAGQSGILSVVDNTSFGDNPSYIPITSYNGRIPYTPDSGDGPVYGSFINELNFTDNVGNIHIEYWTFYWDNTAPSFTWTTAQTNESSPYLYHDGSSAWGYYSDNMGASLQTFNVGGTANDSDVGQAGIVSLTDDTSFGDNPSMSGSFSLWTFAYTIDSGDSSSGSFNITFSCQDNVGNINYTYFYFYEDNTNPSISLFNGSISESSLFLFYDSISTYGYYSDNMGATLASFIITGTSSDTICGLNTTADIVDNTTFGDDPSNTGSTASWLFNYQIDESDDSFGTFNISYRVYDNCNNTNTCIFEFRLDSTAPTVTWLDSSTSEGSPYLYYDGSSQYGYYSDNMGSTETDFTVGGTWSDTGGSGLYNITDNTTFGNSPYYLDSLYDDWTGDNDGLWNIYEDTFDNPYNSTFGGYMECHLTSWGTDGTGKLINYGGGAWGYYHYVVMPTSFSGDFVTSDRVYTINDRAGGIAFFKQYPYATSSTPATQGYIFVLHADADLLYFMKDESTVTTWSRPISAFTWYYLKVINLANTFYFYWGTTVNNMELLGNYTDTTYTSGYFGPAVRGGGYYVDDYYFNNIETPTGVDWSVDYEIDQDDDSLGSFNITYTASDNVGNSISDIDWFYFYLDSTFPTIQLDTGEIVENSPYLYYSGSGTDGFYSNNMGATLTSFQIHGSSTDSGTSSGWLSLVDNTTFGNDPSYSGSFTDWYFDYQIDQDDTGNYYVLYTTTDNVGHTNTTSSFYFYEDLLVPTGTYTLTADPDAIVVNWDNDTTANTVFSSLSDGTSPPASGYNSTHPVKYKLDDGTWGVWNNTLSKTWTTTEGTRRLYLAFHDYVNNTNYYVITIQVDLTDPILGVLEWINPTYSDNWYKALDNLAQFNITWTESYPYLLNATQSSLSYEELANYIRNASLYLTFNENNGTTTYDTSINNLDGTLQDCTWVSGYNGYAVNTSSSLDSAVIVPDSSLISFGNGANDDPFSVFMWIYLYDNDSAQNLAGFFSMPVIDEYREWYFYLTNSMQLGVRLIDESTDGSINSFSTTAIFNTDQWYQVGFTYDGSESKNGLNLWINGQNATSTRSEGGSYIAMEDQSLDLYIGNLQINDEGMNQQNRNLNGSIDEFSIFPRELSVYDILSLNGTLSNTYIATYDGTSLIVEINGAEGDLGHNGGYALNFEEDDDDYVEITDHDDYTFNTGGVDEPFSVFTWVNLESIDMKRILCKGGMGDNPDDSEYSFQIGSQFGIFVYLWDNHPNRIGATAESWLAPFVNFTLGQWYHVGFTYDGSETDMGITIYVDGVNVTNYRDSFGTYNGMPNTDFPLLIGVESYGTVGSWNPQFPMDGLIDRVDIYTSELNSSEVSALYSASLDETIRYNDFEVSIIASPEGWYNITVEIWDNAGNYATKEYTLDADRLKIDNSAPTATFALHQHVEALVSNYYKVAIFYTNVTAYTDNGPFGGSGLPTDFINYKLNTGSYGGWESTLEEMWIGIDQFNNTLYCKLRDNVGLESTVYLDWVIIDLILPVLGWLVLNESYAPNWYDQAVSTCAQASINWVETYPFDVDATCTLAHTDDNSPSGGNSLINFTITGEPDGSYSIAIRIRDRAGNEDTTLLGSEAPIQLRAGMGPQENWFYFYFFKNDATGLDWRDFNTSYVLDELYRNYTEIRMRGALYAQKYLNLTSSIRFIVRNYFGDVISNSSYTLPDSFDLYITLDVNILKVANLYDEVMNMTIERPSSSQVFTEQIMPNEIWDWDMYAAVYNVTIYIHGTSTIALERDGTSINDFQANLSISDYAMFVDAPLTFNTLNMIISEIWQFNILTNKDHKSLQPTVNIYMNDSGQGSGDFSPGTIVLSRPTYGYYNLTVYATWQTYTTTYQRWITVESNAEVTTWTVSGQNSESDIIAIAWNTNKGTGTLRVYDNSSLIATDSVEGALTIVKSSVVGLHNLTMNITVETLTFTAYADYTISDWSAVVVVYLYSESAPYVSVDEVHTATIAVTQSDDDIFSGYVFVNGTSITVVNGAGTFTVVNYDVEQIVYSVTNVQDLSLENRSYIANDLTVTFDRLIGSMGIVDIGSDSATFRVSFNNSYDNLMVTNFEYAVYVNDDYIKSSREVEFTLEGLSPGEYTVELKRIDNLDNNVDTGTCNLVPFTIEAPPELLEEINEKVVQPFSIPIILIIIVVAGIFVRRYFSEKEKNANGMGGLNRQMASLESQFKKISKRQ